RKRMEGHGPERAHRAARASRCAEPARLRDAPPARLQRIRRLPRVIPIGFYWNGSQIVICTAATAPKVKALLSRPDVATTIDVGDTPTDSKQVLMRGIATVDIVDGVPDEYIATSRKVLDAEHVPEFERSVRSIYDKMAVIRI